MNVVPLAQTTTIKIMDSNKIRRLPIIENDDKLLGIISETDILKVLGKKKIRR